MYTLRCSASRASRQTHACAILLGVLLGLGGLVAAPSGVHAADNPHNIPGVALSSASASGQLGGPIYDVVYRIEIPAGHILSVAMTGSAGTDFDLYLFNSAASDIYADPPVGLVASSTGPTSTESISYPSVGGGTYYIDLSGATNVEGTYNLSVQVLADTEPPHVALSLDGGAPATNNPLVSVGIVAADDLTGVATMSFSQDGMSWTSPAPYQPSVTLNLGGSDGLHTVWVRVTDGAGNVSAPVRASIYLDRVPPTVLSRSPGAGGIVDALRPSISVRFSKAIQPISWDNAGLILQNANGTILYGSYSYDASTNTGTFTPAVPLQPGATYVASLGSVTDLAGNHVAPVGAWTFTALLAPSVTVKTSPAVVVFGQEVAVTGAISPVVSGSLVLESKDPGGTFLPLLPLTTGATGGFTTRIKPTGNSWLRVRYEGSSLSAATSSSEVRVLVRPGLSFRGVDPTVVQRVPALQSQTLVAVVAPSAPNVPLTLSIYRLSPSGAYVLQTHVTRTSKGGRYTFHWTPGRGAYYVRLTSSPIVRFANGISPLYRWLAH